MKRDAAGKFVNTWDSEVKRRVSVTLTDTAWQLLEEEARKRGISRSEVIEHTARSFTTDGNPPNETKPAEQQHTQLIAAEETGRKVSAILESISDAFVALDRNWHYTYVNQAATKILGRTSTELLGKHIWNDVFPELVGKTIYEQLHRAVEEQVPGSWEEYEQPLQRWLEMNAHPSDEGVVLHFRDVTERKQSEQTLQTTAERLGLALAAAKLGDWSWDAATDLVTLSERAAEIFDIPPSASLTWTQMRDLLHKDDRERTRIAVEQAIANHHDYSAEYRVLRRDGSECWVAASGRAHYAPTGDVIGMFGVVQNITQRKRLEAESQSQKQQFKMLAENAPDIIARFDSEFRHLYISPCIERATGLPASAFIGKTNEELGLPEEHCLIWRNALEQGFATGQEQQLDFEFLTPEGRRWYQAYLMPEFAPDGSIQSILGITRDFHLYKQAEQALRQSEERLRFALEAANMVAWEWNLITGQVVRSHTSHQILGINSVAAVEGDSEFFNLIHPDDRDTVLRLTEQAIAQKSPYCAEFRIIKPDGSLRWMFDQGRVTCNDAGEVVRMSGVIQDITTRKQAEEALCESQILYQTLAEALPSLVWTLTPDGRLDYVNEHWRDALGVTLEQVNQVGWSLIVHPDDLPHSLENWEKIQSGESITEQEYRHRMADGSYRWFLARMLVIRDEQGQLIRIVGASTDIDARKQTEDALRSSEERLALASQAAKVGTFEWNIQTNEVFWTAEEEALYGLPPGSFGGQLENWKQSVHPDDLNHAEQDLLDAVANRTDLNNEFRVVHPNGSVRWIAAKGRVFYNSENRPLRMIGMNEDITERKQLEVEREQLLQQLEASLGQFEAVINSMTGGLLVSDAEGNVLLFNPAALVLHEYDSVEQVRRHLRDFPDTFEGHDAQGNLIPLEEWPLGRVLSGETYRDYEIYVHRLDTGSRWIGNFSGTPVYDKQGQMILAIVTMHDITERKRAEAERLQLLEQEREAREQAEAANRIKDEFLAVLSHELRTPLNPILGWSRLLRQGKLAASRTAAALETIERNAKLQIQLIDDLLDISRILQGKLSLNSVSVDLKTIITAAIETVQLAAQAKAIHIQTQFECEGITVLGDPTRLQQVVWNLLTNAVKFTPETGQIQVRLSITQSQAQIQVADTGKGIRSEFLPYVFDTFRQADSTTTRVFGGLGLGLAIVRRIVELHGGMIQAESLGEKQGATFTVRLPLLPIPAIPEQEMTLINDKSELQGVQVLAVDDEFDNLELATFMLEEAGASVIAVSSAQEALQCFRQTKPDIILSDIGMPEMDGYTLLRHIRALEAEQGNPLTPAIALTAYAGEVDQQQALASGFQRHLPKPVEPEALLQAILGLIHPAKESQNST